VPSNPLMGKFGPIVLLAVVQLVLVVAAPSTAPTAANSALGANPYAPTQNGVPGSATGSLPPGRRRRCRQRRRRNGRRGWRHLGRRQHRRGHEHSRHR
jgi:hypothetical protein